MSFDLFLQIIFLFIFCLILAALEVQIEGGAGWAKNLPSWRPKAGRWYAKIYSKMMSGKELTGYHLMIFGLVFIFMHYPYFVQKSWSFSSELTSLSFFFIVIVVWDFLWFVINPHYDFMDFWKKKVWWHKRWFLHLPIDYWFALFISAILYIVKSFSFLALSEWLLILCSFLSLTLISTILADWAGVFILKEMKGNK
jgi:hypothetical protein